MAAVDIKAIIEAAQAKVAAQAERNIKAKQRDRKDRAKKIQEKRENRNIEARTRKQRNKADKAEMLLMECAPIIVRHLDTKRCMECFAPLPDVIFDPEAENKPEQCECGESIRNSLRRQRAGIDGARITIICSKSERGAFSANIQVIGKKDARNYPPASLRQLAEKNEWVGRKNIEWLSKDDRTTIMVPTGKKGEDGKPEYRERLAGYNCQSVPEMLEEIVRLRKLVHCLEDDLADAKRPVRHCKGEGCNVVLSDGDIDICWECDAKGGA